MLGSEGGWNRGVRVKGVGNGGVGVGPCPPCVHLCSMLLLHASRTDLRCTIA